jgi:hypothetical protein
VFTCGARRVWVSKPEPFTPWITLKAKWLSDEHVLHEEETKVEPAGWSTYGDESKFE